MIRTLGISPSTPESKIRTLKIDKAPFYQTLITLGLPSSFARIRDFRSDTLVRFQ
jgi:hypothetical protein